MIEPLQPQVKQATRVSQTDQPLAASLLSRSFGEQDGEMTIGGIAVSTLAAAYGTPAYVYDANILRGNYRRLKEAVAGFADIYYSIKANPNPAVVKVLVDEGAGLEVASAAEFLVALSAGCAAGRVLFAGPGKGEQELDRVIAQGIGEVHVESFEEIAHIAAIAGRRQVTVPVAIRVNPVAAVQGGAMRMGGRPAPFGFDEEMLDEVIDAIESQPGLVLSGVHLFAGTQILDAGVLLAQWRHAIVVAARVAKRIGRPLRTLDLGGGLGVPYHAGDTFLDLAAVREGVAPLIAMLHEDRLLRDTHLVLEPGRFLTADAGVYLMAVRSIKVSRGTRFVIVDGGMHHHLGASGNLGQVIKRDFPIVAAGALQDPACAPAVVVGPLCTPLDTLGRQASLPALAPGALIAVLQSGAYGLSASPTGFLSHPTPAEVLVENGTHRLVRAPGTFERPYAFAAS